MQLLRDNLVSTEFAVISRMRTNMIQTLWTSSEAEQPAAAEATAPSGATENAEAGDTAAPAAAPVEPERAAAD